MGSQSTQFQKEAANVDARDRRCVCADFRGFGFIGGGAAAYEIGTASEADRLVLNSNGQIERRMPNIGSRAGGGGASLSETATTKGRLNPGLFEDPAWDILLDLYAAKVEGRII